MKFEAQTKKWGSSLGIILPKPIVETHHLSEKERIVVEIHKKHKAEEFFGMFPHWKTPTKQLKQEMKKGW